MSKRKDNVKQYCTVFEPMEYSATDNSACVIAEGHYRDIPFVVVNTRHKYPCAYVNVAQTKLNWYTKVDLDCHGGITYSYQNLPIRNEHGWWLGWNYAHWGDYWPLCPEGNGDNDKKWTTEEVVEECLNVIDAVWDYEIKEGGTE